MKKLALIFTLLALCSYSIPAWAQAKHSSPPAASQTVDKSVIVWVNTKTGVYHYPGSRWYVKTKQGEYLHENEAKKDGFRAAENGQ
jgi:hypothetical protein